MGDLTIDQNSEEQEAIVARTNSPLWISLGCVLLLLALFVAVLDAEGQTAASTPNVTSREDIAMNRTSHPPEVAKNTGPRNN